MIRSTSARRGPSTVARVAALAAALLCACHPLAGPRESGEPAIPRILRYDTELAIDVATKSIRGETAIRFRGPAHGVRGLRFPRHDLVVDGITFEGRDVPPRYDGADLAIALPPGRGPGPEVVRIRYHGAPTKGLDFGDRFVATTFDTCHWMICSEEPGEKASFGLRLSVPEGYRVVAGGRFVETAPDGPGRVRFTVEEGRPYSPYLFGFAAGEFVEASRAEGTTELRFAGIGVSPESLLRRFRETGRMLRFFEARAGVPFPQAVYTQVLVPGSAAQEKSSFSLLGQDELDPILVDATEDWAIAHELAHQWWGNLVTCRTWSHFWLNESLATFMVAAWKEERWGRAAYQHELDLFRKRHARAIDAGFDVPLAYSGTYPSLGIRRAIQYSKGALFLHLLRQELGEDVFWSGLRQFTSEHAGGAVVSSDFQSAMQRASGKDLGPLFRTWVHDSFHREESVRRQK